MAIPVIPHQLVEARVRRGPLGPGSATGRLESATAHLLRQPPALERAAAEARGALERLPPVHRTGLVRQRTAETAAGMRRHPDVPAAREFVEYAADL